MVHYWLSVVMFSFRQTLDFLGKSKGGILFDVLVFVFAFYRLKQKHGWDGMKDKFKETLLEGVVIAFIAGTIVFVCEFVAAPPAMNLIALTDVEKHKSLQHQAESNLVTCGGILSTQTEKANLLEDQKNAQQLTINSDQTQLNSQQGVISQCVVSLGKMNPKVREQINVVSVPMYHMDNSGHVGAFPVTETNYISEVFITTNETEAKFHGSLKCEKAFNPVTSPMTPHISQTTSWATIPPAKISDHEWEISEVAANSEWSPSRPVYLSVRTKEGETAGKCTFTPME